MKLTVKTETAIHALKNHLAVHLEEYVNQLSGWQEKMKQYGELLAAWAAEGGNDADRPDQPKKPQSFKTEYKRLLKMLEVHEGETIIMEEEEFDEIFMDRFGWKRTFHQNSALYSVASLQSADDE